MRRDVYSQHFRDANVPSNLRTKTMFLYAKLLKRLRGTALKGSVVHATSKVEPGSEVYFSTMDKHSFCGYHCEINHCDIGSFYSIANQVIIGGGTHPMHWAATSPAFYVGRDSIKAKFSEHPRDAPRRTTIGHDVWIGARAIIRQGVNIGTGAIIGMGAVVTRDVLPYEVVAGVPARHLRLRFSQELIERLLASQWWDADDATLTRAAIHVRDPEAFIKEVGH